MAQEAMNAACKCVRPIMSVDFYQSHRRVMRLYRTWYRYIPMLLKVLDIPKTEEDVRCMIRSYFYKNACVTDIRVIDVLVIKGHLEFDEVRHMWQQKGHIMAHWNPTLEPKPCTFLGKFLNGVD